MIKLLGLWKKEWVLYKSWWFAAIFVGFVLYAAEFFLEESIKLTDIRLALTAMILLIGNVFVMMQFLASLRYDIKTKQIWLHSTSSIAQLISVKIFFTVGCSIVYMFIFLSIGYYSSQYFNEATFMQILVMQILFITEFSFAQLLGLVILLYFFTLNRYLKLYIGRFALVLSVGVFFTFMKLWAEFSESPYYGKIFHHGEISFNGLESYLPQIENGSTFVINVVSRYIVADFVFILGFLLLYIITTKWLEKVVLR